MVKKIKNKIATELKVLVNRFHYARRYDVKLLRSLKGIHRGKRGFVVGNGPSLNFEDLEKIKSDVSIASNKIYLAFDKTEFRPSYYTVVDDLVWAKVQKDLPNYFDRVFTSSSRDKSLCEIESIAWTGLPLAKPSMFKLRFSRDLSKGAYGGATVTYENLQFAVHLGLNPIYIIGCDHYYAGEANSSKDAPSKVGGNNNHFVEGYRKEGEIVNPAPIEQMNTAFQVAREFADRHDITILNATRGGYLNSFERISFDDIF